MEEGDVGHDGLKWAMSRARRRRKGEERAVCCTVHGF